MQKRKMRHNTQGKTKISSRSLLGVTPTALINEEINFKRLKKFGKKHLLKFLEPKIR